MPSPEWEQQRIATLDNAKLKRGLKLLWFATGSEDFLVETTKATLEMLKKHGFSPVYKESAGGHTWINWRNYLNEFAQQLFQQRRALYGCSIIDRYASHETWCPAKGCRRNHRHPGVFPVHHGGPDPGQDSGSGSTGSVDGQEPFA
jgi:hypothetical protein